MRHSDVIAAVESALDGKADLAISTITSVTILPGPSLTDTVAYVSLTIEVRAP